MLYICVPLYTCGGQRTSSSKSHFHLKGDIFILTLLQVALPSQLACELLHILLSHSPIYLPKKGLGLYKLSLLCLAVRGFWRLELRSSDLSVVHLYSPGKLNLVNLTLVLRFLLYNVGTEVGLQAVERESSTQMIYRKVFLKELKRIFDSPSRKLEKKTLKLVYDVRSK